MNGFINLLKPVGATASDMVVCVKHILKEKKVGHLGTLDPGASGVLPIAVGQATKLFNFLTDKVKYYRAFFTFGATTDTLDSYGIKIAENYSVPSKSDILSVLDNLRGEITQTPPAYSAISIGGVKAYSLARQGIDVTLKERKVTIYSLDLLSQIDECTFVFDIKCSAGTYIRTIAQDLAKLCGTVAYMSALIRLQSGCFTIGDAFTIEEIREKKSDCLTGIMYSLGDVEEYVFPDKYFDDINYGRKVNCPFGDEYRKIFCGGIFFGLGKNIDGKLKIEYYLKDVN